jgi:ketosteroid isomerase-like protein
MGSNLFSGVYEKKNFPALFGDVKDMFPDGLKMIIHNMIGERDYVAVEAESYGKHASGKIYNNRYHFLFRFKDGLILEMKEYFDTEHSSDVLCGGRRPSTEGGS